MSGQAQLPLAARQYVSVRFRPWDRRSYTYHNDGEPVTVGDHVIVSTGRGTEKVEVVGITADKPDFDTKPIQRGISK
jgi:hypothetical protein